MKKWGVIIVLLVLGLGPIGARAQSAEVQQLILNVEKLAEFKKTLATMEQYYQILRKGYNVVRDLAQGNFSLHKVFLDGLLEVSPTVRQYHRIVDIIHLQLQLAGEYKVAFTQFKASQLLNEQELDYLGRVYGQLASRSMDNLDDLITVITAGKLRMSDNERLETIDGIWKDMKEKLAFQRSFNNQTRVLLIQRSREKADANGLSKMMDVNE